MLAIVELYWLFELYFLQDTLYGVLGLEGPLEDNVEARLTTGLSLAELSEISLPSIILFIFEF